MEITKIEIPSFSLEWSDWFEWDILNKDSRNDPKSARVPNKPGVYEVKIQKSDERLTIGKAANLRMRVKQGLIKGKVPHSSGKRIRESENLTEIVVRWAITDRPSCAEEELHKKYLIKFGKLPKYTRRT